MRTFDEPYDPTWARPQDGFDAFARPAQPPWNQPPQQPQQPAHHAAPRPPRSDGRTAAAVVAAVLGTLTAIFGYLMAHNAALLNYGGHDIAQVNGICTSSLGELAQTMSGAVAQHCGTAGTVEQASGILVIFGIVAALAAVIYLAVPLARSTPQTP